MIVANSDGRLINLATKPEQETLIKHGFVFFCEGTNIIAERRGVAVERFIFHDVEIRRHDY